MSAGGRVLILGLPYFGRRLAGELAGLGWNASYLSHPGKDAAGWARVALGVAKADVVYLVGSRAERGSPQDRLLRLRRKPVVIHWVGTDVQIAIDEHRRGRLSPRIAGKPQHWCDAPWLVEELRTAGIVSEYVPLTTGEGGALATSDEELSARVRRLTLHGMSRDAWNRYDAGGSWRYDIQEFGFKDNLTDIAAALGRTQLARLESFIDERTRVAQRYFANLRDEEHLILPTFSEEHRLPWHLFMVRVRNESSPAQRDDVIRQLAERGIGTSVHFIPLHYHTAYRNLGRWQVGDFPIAERIFDGEVSLPMYPGLSDTEVDDVCAALREILHP